MHRFSLSAFSFTLVSLAFLAACKSSVEAGSCLQKGENTCVEYDVAHAAAGKRLCATETWTNGVMSCPSDKRLGICAKGAGAEKDVRFFYPGAPNNYDTASAKTACQAAGGSFAAEPSAP